jgi:hypothetical protein
MKCVETIKTSFASIGVYSNEGNFVLGDPEGPIDWISGEAEAFVKGKCALGPFLSILVI